MHVLLIKLSSLGDIVHTLPAVEDATRQGVTFDWVVEESFADLPALHRGVREVIPSALRRWRRSVPSSLGEVFSFRRTLRKENYEIAIDAQGLIKSAVVGRWARSSVYAGFNWSSASEAMASLFYSNYKDVDNTAHAVDRLRSLFAQVLGYEVPEGEPDFGLEARDKPGNHCVLIHGTTWATKLWPEEFWVRIARRAVDFGMTPVLPWYSQVERLRAERIASQVDGSEAVGSLRLASVVGFLARARAILGVDTGLSHLAAALGRPTVVVFGPTDSRLTGSKGVNSRNLQGILPCSPCLSSNCQYRGRPMKWSGSPVVPACFASVNPDRVWDEMTALLS